MLDIRQGIFCGRGPGHKAVWVFSVIIIYKASIYTNVFDWWTQRVTASLVHRSIKEKSPFCASAWYDYWSVGRCTWKIYYCITFVASIKRSESCNPKWTVLNILKCQTFFIVVRNAEKNVSDGITWSTCLLMWSGNLFSSSLEGVQHFGDSNEMLNGFFSCDPDQSSKEEFCKWPLRYFF